jgi:hypothetical protein
MHYLDASPLTFYDTPPVSAYDDSEIYRDAPEATHTEVLPQHGGASQPNSSNNERTQT